MKYVNFLADFSVCVCVCVDSLNSMERKHFWKALKRSRRVFFFWFEFWYDCVHYNSIKLHWAVTNSKSPFLLEPVEYSEVWKLDETNSELFHILHEWRTVQASTKSFVSRRFHYIQLHWLFIILFLERRASFSLSIAKTWHFHVSHSHLRMQIQTLWLTQNRPNTEIYWHVRFKLLAVVGFLFSIHTLW